MSEAQRLSLVRDLDASVRNALILADTLRIGLVGIDLDHALCQITSLLGTHEAEILATIQPAYPRS